MTFIFFCTTYYLVSYGSLAISFFLIIWLRNSFLKEKQTAKNKLAFFEAKLLTEKNIQSGFRNTSSKIKQLEDSTQLKLTTIKVELINIDFTYQEIYKNL